MDAELPHDGSPFGRVFERTRDVVNYQTDPATTGRPVSFLLGGGLLAVVSAVLCGLLAYDIWYRQEVSADRGLFGVSLLFVLYVAGVYIFALGFELYDVARAIRLTLVIAVLSVIGLAVMIGVFAVLVKLRAGANVLAGSEDEAGNVLGLAGGFESDEAEERSERHPLDFLIRCPACHQDFTPAPPKAICPWCGKSALTS
jgi:hypothetical protein